MVSRRLIAADLIDEYVLMVHPLVLGRERRLFPEGEELMFAAHQ